MSARVRPSRSRARGSRATTRCGVAALAVTGVWAVVGAPAAVAAPTPVIGAPVPIPQTCRAAMTLVRPDTTLAMGVVQGRTGTLYSTGHKLGFTPKAMAYLGTTTNRGITIDRFLVTDPQGRLHRVAVTERPASGGASSVSVTDETIGRGWGSVRVMVATGPYLYGVTTLGGLRRYAISRTFEVSGAGTIATSGWSGVTSLAYGGWWRVGARDAAEDIVALTRSGAVKAYMIPRATPKQFTQRTLIARGWGMFSHLAAGECQTGKARTLAALKPDGQVYAYLDANADDQSGKDIRWAGRAATGWTGLASD